MLPLFSLMAFLTGLRKQVGPVHVFGTTALASLFLFYAFPGNKAAGYTWDNEQKAAILNGSAEGLTKTGISSVARRKAATLATISAADYEANLYWAIPFTPRGTGEGLIQADSGSQFVLLDISVQNTTTDKAVDAGRILLTARVRDENGREYFSNPLVIAAFNLEYPYPSHREQYNGLKGTLCPGNMYRTVAFGFEAPVDTKNFVLLLEGSSNTDDHRLYEAAFTLK